MHHLALVRSLNTKQADHNNGTIEMTTGRKRMPGTDYPHLGAVAAKTLMPDEKFPLPGHILIRSAGPGGGQASYLGPKYASVVHAGTAYPCLRAVTCRHDLYSRLRVFPDGAGHRA